MEVVTMTNEQLLEVLTKPYVQYSSFAYYVGFVPILNASGYPPQQHWYRNVARVARLRQRSHLFAASTLLSMLPSSSYYEFTFPFCFPSHIYIVSIPHLLTYFSSGPPFVIRTRGNRFAHNGVRLVVFRKKKKKQFRVLASTTN